MMHRLRPVVVLACATILVTTLEPQANAQVVVVAATEGGTAAAAGIQAGDQFESWDYKIGELDLGGELESPYDVLIVQHEYGIRGPVRFSGRRGKVPLQLTVPLGEWGLTTRPPFDASLRETYLAADAAAAAGQTNDAAKALENLVHAPSLRKHPVTVAWLLDKLARALAHAQRWDEAEAAAQRALAQSENPAVLSAIHIMRCRTFRKQGRLAEAEAALRAAYEVLADDPTLPLTHASRLYSLGVLADEREHSEQAFELYQEALTIIDRWAPTCTLAVSVLSGIATIQTQVGNVDTARETLDRAVAIGRKIGPTSELVDALRARGGIALESGSYDQAQELFEEALENARAFGPGGREEAQVWGSMCALAESRGDLDTAETLCGREIEFFERTEPESPYTISLLNQLAILAARRGYFQRAEGLMLRVLEFVEAEAPGGLMEAYMRFNLGSLALEKGDLELAASRIRSGRKLIAKVAPQDQRFQASAANNLGLIAGCQERWAEAEEHHRQALELRRQLGDALEVAASLDALAETALKKGDLVQAETCLGEELQITEHEAPNSLKSASTLHNLGVLGRRQGRHKEARELLQAALELRRRLSPGSTAEAETLHELALLGREAGRTNEALAAYRAAVTALEAQTERVGGGHEQRFRYRAAHQAVYGELVDLLLELGRKEDAFAALEHSRAQGFLAMLAERDLVFDAEIPPALDRERRQANARYNALLDQLAEHAATNGQAIAEIEAELMEVRALKQRVREQIRTSSPGLAQLTDPTVVDAAKARELIEANELLLSFHVGPDRTWLFALTNERLDAFAIAVTADELTAKVETFRGLATARAEEALVRRAGAALYELLLAPGEALIEPSEKLLIIPDGPLQVLPFGILVRSPSDAEAPYLIQHHPLTMVSSASVLEWLRNRATRKAIRRAVVFADPTVDGTTDSPTGPRYRSAGVGRLPASRGEAEVLLDLWGADTRTFMGSQATEEHAKSLPRQSDLLHFATHVLVDTRRALDSAIVLAAPHADDREDGLLQAWEILESVRVDARLVTLSGCNTALGEVLPGEGLLGLVRSFHYAGAEAVVASLWPVEDLASAELMRRFYAGIRSGSPPSEALRRAQLELSSGKVQLPDPRPGSFIEKLLGGRRTINASHPFFWAGFVVHGHG